MRDGYVVGGYVENDEVAVWCDHDDDDDGRIRFTDSIDQFSLPFSVTHIHRKKSAS